MLPSNLIENSHMKLSTTITKWKKHVEKWIKVTNTFQEQHPKKRIMLVIQMKAGSISNHKKNIGGSNQIPAVGQTSVKNRILR